MDASFLATIGLIVMKFMLPLSLSFDHRQITLLHIDLIILHGDLIILHGEASVYDEWQENSIKGLYLRVPKGYVSPSFTSSLQWNA